jgi:hypothetical protein
MTAFRFSGGSGNGCNDCKGVGLRSIRVEFDKTPGKPCED